MLNLSHQALAYFMARVPTPSPSLPSGTDTDVQTVINWVAGLAAVACLVGLLVVGAKTAIANQRGDDFNGAGFGRVAVGGIVISSAALIVNAII